MIKSVIDLILEGNAVVESSYWSETLDHPACNDMHSETIFASPKAKS